MAQKKQNKVMRKSLTFVFLFFGIAFCITRSATGSPKPEKSVLFMWWNVENLFDPSNDPATDDDDFTPEGSMNWTEKKLLLKQMRLRHTLSAIQAHPDYRKYPDIVAFAEVENERVFKGTLSPLNGIKYKSIYYESSDSRGIDVALAYNPQTLRPIASKAYTVPMEGRPTRKIIVAGFSAASHPFHVILNHWPSRSFDTEWTERKRISAATVTRHILDSLRIGNHAADIIVMGDFNDEPENRSIKKFLGSTDDAAKVKANGREHLFNCWSGYDGIGSFSFHNKWQHIDQILLSSGMLDSNGLYARNNAFRCFFFSKMLDDSGKRAYATYEKRKYKGGYSDHLPLLLKAGIAE
jgi:hypothetical protein